MLSATQSTRQQLNQQIFHYAMTVHPLLYPQIASTARSLHLDLNADVAHPHVKIQAKKITDTKKINSQIKHQKQQHIALCALKQTTMRSFSTTSLAYQPLRL